MENGRICHESVRLPWFTSRQWRKMGSSIMTVYEFRRFCSELGVSEFVYDTRNQPWYSEDKCLHTISCRFNKYIILANPGRLLLRNNTDSMVVNNIKDILVDKTEGECDIKIEIAYEATIGLSEHNNCRLLLVC